MKLKVTRVTWLEQQNNPVLTNEKRTIKIKLIMLASQAESWFYGHHLGSLPPESGGL